MDKSFIKIPRNSSFIPTVTVINLTLNPPEANRPQNLKRSIFKPKTPNENLIQSILRRFARADCCCGTSLSYRRDKNVLVDPSEVSKAPEALVASTHQTESKKPSINFKELVTIPKIDSTKIQELKERFPEEIEPQNNKELLADDKPQEVVELKIEIETHLQDTTTETCTATRFQSNCLCKEDSSTTIPDNVPVQEKSDTSITDHLQS